LENYKDPVKKKKDDEKFPEKAAISFLKGTNKGKM
jgi:hypothetical protein